MFGEPGFSEGGYSGWQIGTGFITVGPHSEVHGKNAHPGRMILNIESDDVQADYDRMVAAGAIVVRAPYTYEDMPGLIATLAVASAHFCPLATRFDVGGPFH